MCVCVCVCIYIYIYIYMFQETNIVVMCIHQNHGDQSSVHMYVKCAYMHRYEAYLHNDRVTHQNCGYQSSVCLVEGIVEGSQVEHDTERRTPDLYVCMYVCMHVFIYLCIYVRMHVCVLVEEKLSA